MIKSIRTSLFTMLLALIVFMFSSVAAFAQSPITPTIPADVTAILDGLGIDPSTMPDIDVTNLPTDVTNMLDAIGIPTDMIPVDVTNLPADVDAILADLGISADMIPSNLPAMDITDLPIDVDSLMADLGIDLSDMGNGGMGGPPIDIPGGIGNLPIDLDAIIGMIPTNTAVDPNNLPIDVDALLADLGIDAGGMPTDLPIGLGALPIDVDALLAGMGVPSYTIPANLPPVDISTLPADVANILANLNVPAMVSDIVTGAPGSAFVFTATNVAPNTPATVMIDGIAQGTVASDANGHVDFALIVMDTIAAGGSVADAVSMNISLIVDGIPTTPVDVVVDQNADIAPLSADYGGEIVVMGASIVVPLAVGLASQSAFATSMSVILLIAGLLVCATLTTRRSA